VGTNLKDKNHLTQESIITYVIKYFFEPIDNEDHDAWMLYEDYPPNEIRWTHMENRIEHQFGITDDTSCWLQTYAYYMRKKQSDQRPSIIDLHLSDNDIYTILKQVFTPGILGGGVFIAPTLNDTDPHWNIIGLNGEHWNLYMYDIHAWLLKRLSPMDYHIEGIHQ
jgi:hypothetical protein